MRETTPAVMALERLFENVDRDVIEATLEQFGGNTQKSIELLVNLNNNDGNDNSNSNTNNNKDQESEKSKNNSDSQNRRTSRSRLSRIKSRPTLNDEKEKEKDENNRNESPNVPRRMSSINRDDNRKSALRALHRMFEQFDKEVSESLLDYKQGNTEKAIQYLIHFKEMQSNNDDNQNNQQQNKNQKQGNDSEDNNSSHQ